MDELTRTVDITTENAALKARIAELEQQVSWLLEQIKPSRKREFGASSEKSEYDFEQETLYERRRASKSVPGRVQGLSAYRRLGGIPEAARCHYCRMLAARALDVRRRAQDAETKRSRGG
jgi:hypothetical protein